MDNAIQKKADFMDIYNKSHRLATAVFMISNVMDGDEELKTKIKKLALELVSMSVNLKDTAFNSAQKIISDIEKNSLELMSLLDIASVSGLVSSMNGNIIKEEFQLFVSELGNFSGRFEENKNSSVKNIFSGYSSLRIAPAEEKTDAGLKNEPVRKSEPKNGKGNGFKNQHGMRRKDLRKNMILEFIKGHDAVSIKDIVPNVTGCSEKTVQRELIVLINEGKIKKTGERRWSKYSII